MFITDLHITDYIFLGVLGFLFLAQLYFYARYMCAPARKMRSKGERLKVRGEGEDVPGVSVILCAHNESENLSHFLQALLTQDYPTYEVIVVDDGSEDDTRLVVERYLAYDKRLHLTFVPCGARVRSTKKLALTLGAKAAQYDYLLLTDADCVPASSHWISEMTKGFEKKDIVLGFGAYFKEDGYVNRMVRYDTLFNGLHFLGAAICGHPYMGVGRNLAYRKSIFFESGGFTHLMNVRAGDDDLFVNRVATRKNTGVVVNPDAITWSLSKKTLKEWIQQKQRHLSVSPEYRLGTKIRLFLEPFTRGLFYAAVVAMLVLYWPTSIETISIPFAAATGAFLLRWILQTAVLNGSARRMRVHRFNMMSILWFDLTLPLVSLCILSMPKRKNIKW